MEKIKISDVAEQIRGVSYKPEDVVDGSREGAIGILRANNISDGVINFNDLVFVKRDRVSQKQILRKGDILICASSGSKHLVGKAAQIEADCEYSFGAFCKVVRPQKIDALFLGMYFQSDLYRKYISGVSQGANINNIKNEHIDVIEIRGYSNDEQVKIAELLQIVIGTIRLQKEQIKRYDVLVKSRFVELFGDPKINPWGWKTTTLGNECYYVKDGPHKSLSDIGKENGGYPFISVRNIVNGYIDFSTAKYISDEDYQSAIKKCHPEKGDILYSKGGTTGIAKLVDVDVKFANWVHLAVLKFDKAVLNGVFLENMLNCDYCYTQSQKLTKGIANRDLVLSAMAQIKIYKPPIELQNQFATFVHQIDKLRVEEQRKLEKTQILFDSLMQQYFG